MSAINGGSTTSTSAWFTAAAFALTFLLAVAFGGRTTTATVRGVVVASIVWFVSPVLVRLVRSVVLDAIARDRVQDASEPTPVTPAARRAPIPAGAGAQPAAEEGA